ncbi:MAG: diguanylate cyclase [Nitrospirae bacterium]|nr:MAG: diguanylate cyclase [Nitrospirota bacterium]
MRVLIAEADALARRVLETALTQWGHEVAGCADGVAALQLLLGATPFDYALLDWSLAELDGPKICRAVRKQSAVQTYLLLLCKPDADQVPLAALDAGADDALLKPVDADQLQFRLHAGQKVLELRRELASAQETLRVKTLQDPVTGLWNREALTDSMDRELDRARREGAPLGFVLLDVDDFRLVNDTLGRRAGDGALRQVGQRLRRSLRPYDVLGRYGGDQFLAILPGCDEPLATALAERLRTSVSAQPIALDEGTIRITLSAGIAAAGGMQERRPADALACAAEAALYRAKQPGQHSLAVATKGAWLNIST